MVATFGGTQNQVGNGFGVFFLFLFVFFYGATMDATSYVYCSEIFPTPVRAQGSGFSVAGLFTATLIYTQVAPIAFAKIGWKYYLVFIIVPIMGAACLYKFFPETKKLSLEEIAALFGDDVALEVMVRPDGKSALEVKVELSSDQHVDAAGTTEGVSFVGPGSQVSFQHNEAIQTKAKDRSGEE